MLHVFILIIGIGIGLLISYFFKRFLSNKIKAPSYDQDKPFMVAIGLKGEVYSFRKISHLYPIMRSPIIQNWSDEGATIKSVTQSELIILISKIKT